MRIPHVALTTLPNNSSGGWKCSRAIPAVNEWALVSATLLASALALNFTFHGIPLCIALLEPPLPPFYKNILGVTPVAATGLSYWHLQWSCNEGPTCPGRVGTQFSWQNKYYRRSAVGTLTLPLYSPFKHELECILSTWLGRGPCLLLAHYRQTAQGCRYLEASCSRIQLLPGQVTKG